MNDSGWLDANRSMWDERVPIHASGDFWRGSSSRS